MKNGKKMFVCFLAIVLLCGTIPFSVSASPSRDRYGRSVLQQMEAGGRLVAAYDCLADGVEAAREVISMPKGGNTILVDELKTVFAAVYADYPEFFWLNGGYGCSYDPMSMQISEVQLSYSLSGNALKTAKAAFDKKTDELVKGLKGKSDYEISKTLHDRLAAAVRYVHTANDQNAYGALGEGEAVCSGYARSYQHLLQKAGIAAWLVTGHSINPATGNPENHAWTMSKLDGHWYYSDVTWDDQGDTLYHAYLNQTWDRISEDHTATDFTDYLPKENYTEDGYFAKEGGIVDRFDAAVLAQRLQADGMTTHLYVTGDKSAYVRALQDSGNMRQVLRCLGQPNAGYSWSLGSLGRELVLTVNVIPVGHQHKLSPVAEKAASCSSTGHKAYYTCDCGQWFSDAAGKNEITDKNSVTVAALSHVASEWQSDTHDHWKVCTRIDCGKEIAGSRAAHDDGNKDQQCDTCGATLPKADGTMAPPPTTTAAPRPTTTTAAKKTTAPVTAVPNGTTVTGDTADGTTGSEVNATTTQAAVPDEMTTTTAEQAGETNTAPQPMTWIFVAAGVFVVAAAAAGGLVVFLRRR